MRAPPCVVVLDVDGTCTPKKKALCRAVDLDLSPDAKKVTNQMWRRFILRSLEGKLNSSEEREWICGVVDAYVDSGLTAGQYLQSLSAIQPRPGLRECLMDLKERGIPVALVSFGIADFVKVFLRRHNLDVYVEKVFALELSHNSNVVIGYKSDTVVVPSNKGLWSQLFAVAHDVERKNILAVGDSGSDKTLGGLKKNRLGIAKDPKEAQRLRHIMGKVVVTDSFIEAHEWLIQKVENMSS